MLSHGLLCGNGMTITSYRDLEAWQLGMTLAENVYALTRTFPREELFGLTSQMRRAAVAIPSNLAELSQPGSDRFFTGSREVFREPEVAGGV